MTRATAVRIEPRPLSGTPLTEAWLAGSPASAALFPGPAGDLDSYLAKAREVDGRTGAEDRRLASSCLTGGGASGAARLAAFIDEGGFVVTTGQQPGLFGGPLYALYKGLTAAALASRLEAATGRPVLPVFWIASEDHDWEEVRTAHVLDVGNRLREVALPDGGPNPHRPIHRIRAGLEMAEALGHFLTLMPETDFLPRWRSLLEEACRPESTLSDAYAVLLGALLGPAGVFTVAAHHPALKRRALPLLLTELGERRGARGGDPEARSGDTGGGLRAPGPVSGGGDERLRREGGAPRTGLSGWCRLPPPGVRAPDHLPRDRSDRRG